MPRPSAKNNKIRIFLSAPTQLVFTATAADSVMTFETMHLFLAYLKIGLSSPYFIFCCYNAIPYRKVSCHFFH